MSLSIRVYLDKKVQKMEGYEERTVPTSHNWIRCTFKGVEIYSGQAPVEEFYVSLSDPEEPVPKEVQDLITGASLIARHPRKYLNRHCGRYELKSATGTVDVHSFEKGQEEAEVRIKGKKLDDVVELYRKIRAGQIFPFEDWEGPQQEPQKEPRQKPQGTILRLLKRVRLIH